MIYLMDCVFGDVAGNLWHRSYYDGGGYWLDWHDLTRWAVGSTPTTPWRGHQQDRGRPGALYALTYGVDGRLYLGFGHGGASTSTGTAGTAWAKPHGSTRVFAGGEEVNSVVHDYHTKTPRMARPCLSLRFLRLCVGS